MIPYTISFIAAIILGMSKSGLKGMGVVIVTLMALVHGAKASTGIVLPLLIFADILAVTYYNRHTQWKYLIKFLPWMILGVLIAVFVGKDLPENIFKKGMAVIILVSVVIMFLWERYDKKNIPNKVWFAGSTGLMAGFTTMIGNLAGAFTNIFFLATRIPKNEFIGTAAWLFFIINLFKLPFHIFSWKTITAASLLTDLYLIPAVILGFILGLKVVKLFKDHQYRKFILLMTAIGGIVILLK
ncbi:sulfite exporter TauE/SafE family protein [Aquimarina sp. RZ0]|uniref:sulfite exporter TauE/SafE family protein n=1 Tax=Aquimarina sp. RZ0 TaxID=2607730 RepID=UPI0011F0AA80|nr:sulfite exporter TauE/SafE family protein [Aquimarina sp. RZ0]KAA1242681.1 sulfite exporter TauE/SafE family protein [Aquimarina sp. RZ0]